MQEGIRWIPGYRIELASSGMATVHLQGTLSNTLLDVSDATLNLVIGVPRFAFSDMVDPISLQEALTRVATRAQPGTRTSLAFGNALTSQVAFNQYSEAAPAEAPSPIPGGAEQADELFVFTVPHVTLARGQSMVLPITSFEVPFEDIYRLELPASVPPDIRPTLASNHDSEIEQALRTPQVTHVIRLSNTSSVPFTTAPALILRGGRILAQGMIRYAAPGLAADVEVTRALDIPNTNEELITSRTPQAVRDEAGNWYSRVDLRSAVTVTNRRAAPIHLEVVRTVTGRTVAVSEGGSAEDLSHSDPRARVAGNGDQPWWAWYWWPWWWHHHNGIGRFAWSREVEAGASVTFTADWCYYWR
ncbi:MAG: hypothetical protein KDA21_01410 [Phycisphaerales bacterium]|nr:hypothetical protein [Phycisphaerales bacterium]